MSSASRSLNAGLQLDDLMPITYEDEDEDYAEKPSIQPGRPSRADRESWRDQDVILSF